MPNVIVTKIDEDAGPLQAQLAVRAHQQTIDRSRDGQWLALRALRDGSPVVAPWHQALVFEGLVFCITVGAFSTGIAGGGATAPISAVRPQFTVAMPTGQSMLPIHVGMQVQVEVIVADNDEAEALLAADRTQAVTTGTATEETIFSMRTDHRVGSSATARSAYSGDTPALTIDIELDRVFLNADVQGTAATALWTPLKLDYSPAVAPVLVGPATLLGFFGGTNTKSGFAQVVWAELPTSAFT